MPTTAIAKPPPTDGEILNAFTDPNCTTKYLCEEFNFSLRKLEEWMDRPDIQESIQRLQRINESRARVVALEHVSWAVSTLANLAGAIHVGGQLPRPETARKAANAILHLSGLTKGSSHPRGRKRARPNPPALPCPNTATSAFSAVNRHPALTTNTRASNLHAQSGASPNCVSASLRHCVAASLSRSSGMNIAITMPGM